LLTKLIQSKRFKAKNIDLSQIKVDLKKSVSHNEGTMSDSKIGFKNTAIIERYDSVQMPPTTVRLEKGK
jgi:hypothetical protein